MFSTECRVVIIFILLLILAVPACCDVPIPPVIQAVEVSAPPVLDGVLDDECWQKMPEFTGFVDAPTRTLMDEQTIVKFCYDKENMYISVHAVCGDVSRIKAEETKRNGNVGADDNVKIIIDSAHTHTSSSEFSVNALGTQLDTIERTSGNKIEWRGDWRAKAKIVDDGYNVEMAIPFSMFIYNPNQTVFGLMAARNHPQKQVVSQWPDLNGVWNAKYAADWVGLTLPHQRPKPILMGYVLGTSTDGDNEVAQGLDLRYPFSSDASALVSIKPEFSSIEQSVDTVDFSYTERMLPDYRPFFQEWGLPMNSRLFYSRRVPDFDIGARYSSRSGQNNYGFMNVRDSGTRNDSLFAYKHDFNDISYLTFNLADHREPGRSNSSSYLRGRYGWTKDQRYHGFTGGVFASATSDKPDGQVRHFSYSTYGKDGELGAYIDFFHGDKDFNGELGFSPELNINGMLIQLDREKSFRNRNLNNLYSIFNYGSYDYMDGSHYRETLNFSNSLGYVDGHSIGVSYTKQSMRVWEDEDFKFYRDSSMSVSYGWGANKPKKNGSIGYTFGRKAGGDYTSLGFGQNFKFRDNLAAGLSYSRVFIGDTSKHKGTWDQYIMTVNYDITPEKGIGGRMVRQYGKDNMYLIYRQQVRQGMDIFLIYGDPNALETTNKISLKLVRPLNTPWF
ncbi:MAG: carbohydrate binding family 9 domain-containing protein [Armatimonadota bacterium]